MWRYRTQSCTVYSNWGPSVNVTGLCIYHIIPFLMIWVDSYLTKAYCKTVSYARPYKSCISLIFPSVICTPVSTHVIHVSHVIRVPQVSVLPFVFSLCSRYSTVSACHLTCHRDTGITGTHWLHPILHEFWGYKLRSPHLGGSALLTESSVFFFSF